MIDLGEELKLPSDIAFAVDTGRPELIFDRELGREEQGCVLNLCRVLLKKVFEQQMDLDDTKLKFDDILENIPTIDAKLTECHDVMVKLRSSLRGG